MKLLEKFYERVGFTEELCSACNRRSRALWNDRRRADTIKNPFSREWAHLAITLHEQLIRMWWVYLSAVVILLCGFTFQIIRYFQLWDVR